MARLIPARSRRRQRAVLGVGGRGADGGGGEDLELDLTQRHPGGTVLEVSGLRFEGNTMLVDAEFINGATRDIRLRIGANGGNRLRLIDDLGNTYNFVVPDDEGNEIELSQGETIGGEFAFLGPLDGGATSLTMTVNIYDPIEEFPLEDAFAGTGSPEFAVEIPRS